MRRILFFDVGSWLFWRWLRWRRPALYHRARAIFFLRHLRKINAAMEESYRATLEFVAALDRGLGEAKVLLPPPHFFAPLVG